MPTATTSAVPAGPERIRTGQAQMRCPGGRSSGSEADGAADAGSADAAVTGRVLREILLVVVLRIVKRRRCDDLGGDTTVTRAAQSLFVSSHRGNRGLALRVVEVVDAGPVLGADVVALPVRRGRVVVLPERLHQLIDTDDRRVVGNQHRFGVAGHHDDVDVILESPRFFERDFQKEQSAKLGVTINAIDGAAAGVENVYVTQIVRDFNNL